MKPHASTQATPRRHLRKTTLLLAGGIGLLAIILSTTSEATPPPCGTGTRSSGGPARTFAAQGIRWRGNAQVRIGNRMHTLNPSVRTYYDICACAASNATARAIVTGLANARATLPQGCPPAAASTVATDPTPPPPPAEAPNTPNQGQTPPTEVTTNTPHTNQPAPPVTQPAPPATQPAPPATQPAPPVNQPAQPSAPQGPAQGSLSQEASVYQAHYSRSPTRTHQTCLASWNNPDDRRFCHVELVNQNGQCPAPSSNGQGFSGPYFRTSNPVGFCVAGDVNGWDYVRFGTADCRNLIPRMNGRTLNDECWNLGNSNKTINVRQYRAKQESITRARLCSTGGISSRNCWVRKPAQTQGGLNCDRTRGYVRTQTGAGEALCVKWANSSVSGAPSCSQTFGPAVQATCDSNSWNGPQPE